MMARDGRSRSQYWQQVREHEVIAFHHVADLDAGRFGDGNFPAREPQRLDGVRESLSSSRMPIFIVCPTTWGGRV
jgi:hypothetical protein